MVDLESLIERNDRSLRALAYRLLGDRDAMDDVLQDAYAKAYRGLARFRGESAAGTGLYRVVTNACLDELRRRRPTESLADEPAWPDAADEVVARDELAAALADLTPVERAAERLSGASSCLGARAPPRRRLSQGG